VREDLSEYRTQVDYSELTLVAEIARYLNLPALEIEMILTSTKQGLTNILNSVNTFNEILYDWILPRLFHALYDIRERTLEEEYEVELVKKPLDKEYYEVSGDPDKVVTKDKVTVQDQVNKSFHVDTYCFDSGPEHKLFWGLLRDGRVKQIYFTGMLTHGQSEFYIQYIDPESHTIRSYYPDFLMQTDDGAYVIIEVKGDNKINDPIVLAKQAFAEQTAGASGMKYRVIAGTEADKLHYESLFTLTKEAPQQPKF
jgi:hypothetical protein